jgi:hypothetical protein
LVGPFPLFLENDGRWRSDGRDPLMGISSSLDGRDPIKMERGKSLRWLPSSHLVCVYEGGIRFFFLFLISKQILIKERKSSSRSQLLLITSDQISQKGKDGHIIRLCYKKPPHHHQPKRKQKTHHTRVVTGRVDFGSFLPHLIAQHTGGQSNRRVVGAAAARLESKFSRHIIIGKRMQNICRSTCDKYPIKNKEI